MAKKKSKAATNTTLTTGMHSSSQKGVLLVGRPAKEALPPAPDIAELNERMNADPARIMRMAGANTQRLSGKPVL